MTNKEITSYFLVLLVSILITVAFFESIVGYWLRYIILAAVLLCSIVFLKFHKIKNNELLWFTFLLVFYLISMIINNAFILPNLYIAPLLGYIFSKIDKRVLYKGFITLLWIQLALVCYETFTQSFIYVAKSAFSDDVLDEKTYGGAIGIFRAKGFFEGPTTLGAVCILISIILRKSLLALILSTIICTFASARLGMIVCFLMILYFLYIKYAYRFKFKTRMIFLAGCILLLIVLAVMFLVSIAQHFQHLSTAFDFQSSQNINRVLMWVMGTKHYLSYDTVGLLFGYYGDFRRVYGNSPESSWLNLLVEGGSVLFLFYVLYTFKGLKGDLRQILPMFLLVLSGLVVTLFASFSTVLLYFTCVNLLKEKAVLKC